jgi:hypothetical protein
MQSRRNWPQRAFGAALLCLLGGLPLPLGAQPEAASAIAWTGAGPPPPPGLVPPCDQYDPSGPIGSARIALDSRDLVHRGSDGGGGGHEMRSFIETGSIGKVDVAIVSASPPGAVLGISATPEISRLSPYFGERLKGIAIDVALVAAAAQRPRVVLDLRQVCARHFRNTFLYY